MTELDDAITAANAAAADSKTAAAGRNAWLKTAAYFQTLKPPVPPAGKTFESETAYTKTPPPFTVVRSVPVSSQAGLAQAIANLQPGDSVYAADPFNVTGQFAISKKLTGPARITLSGVSFQGGTSNVYGAVWIVNSSNLRLYGGTLSNPYDQGILVNSAQNVLWWGFKIDKVGGGGLAMFPNGGDITGCDFAGEISNWGSNAAALDPHSEKGTGVHGANLADVGQGHLFSNNRLALDLHDGPTGAGVEIGDPSGSPITANTLYLRALRLTQAAKVQVAGNALQTWGSSKVGLHIPYLEAQDCQGRAVLTSQSDASGVSVDYGRATRMCLNPAKTDGLPQDVVWDRRAGVVYGDVQP